MSQRRVKTPKRLLALIGKPYEKELFHRQAAKCGIRLCVTFDDTINADNGTSRLKRDISTHYYTSLDVFNITARERHAISRMNKIAPGFHDKLKRVDRRLREEFSENDIQGIDQMTLITTLARAGDELMMEVERLRPQLESVLEEETGKMDRMRKRGFLLPWDHLGYVAERVKLDEKPMERYKGRTARANVHDGIVTTIEVVI